VYGRNLNYGDFGIFTVVWLKIPFFWDMMLGNILHKLSKKNCPALETSGKD
jgi:hypothetical protein